jgi:outer membrane protein
MTFRLPLALALFALTALPLHATEAPLSLSAAIREALTRNPDAVLARHRIDRAGAIVMQADAMVWPSLTFRSGYQHTDNPVGVFGAALNQSAFSPGLNFNNVPDADNLNVAGVVTVPVYTGGQVSAERKAAAESRAAETHTLAAVQNQLAFEVVRSFFTIRKTRAFVAAARAAVGGFEENLEIARKRFDGGKALRADVLDLEVRLAQSREDLVQARNADALARRALAHLLGRETELIEITEATPETQPPSGDTQALRPETAALYRRKLAAEAAVKSALSGFLPKVSAFATAEHNHGWKFNSGGNNYTAGLLLNWKLWDGHLTRGKVAEARAEADFVNEQQRRLRLAIEFEIQQAKLQLETSEERVEVTRKAVELAAESVQLTRVRFEQGLALATQLIDAETALTGARVRQAQADADRHIAVAALRKALGLPQLEADAQP